MKGDTKHIAGLIRKKLILDVKYIGRQTIVSVHRPLLNSLQQRPSSDQTFAGRPIGLVGR